MSLQETITQDQTAVAAAQSALDEASAKLATDQAAQAAVTPHLTGLQEMQAFISNLVPGAEAEFVALIDKLKALLGA